MLHINIKHGFKKNCRKIIIPLLAFSLVFSSPVAYAAKNAEESGEMSDEEWEKVKDEFTDLENIPEGEWDHKTWDTEHKELAWTVFGTTEWTDKSFPNLFFGGGINHVDADDLTNMDSDTVESVREYIANYKNLYGMYSIKNNEDNTADNSAYVSLVLVCMDVLKTGGGITDPYSMGTYVSKQQCYTTESTTTKTTYEQNIAREIYRRIIYAEKYYNNLSNGKRVNIYDKYNDSDGLLKVIQSVIYGSSYAKDTKDYSEENAAAYFEAKRADSGFEDWPDFAKLVLDKYPSFEITGNYIMDAFGKRINGDNNYEETDGSDDEEENGGKKKKPVYKGEKAKKLSSVKLSYSGVYNVSSNPLTRSKGVVYYGGHKETYYSQRILAGGGLNIPGRHVADDGTIRDGDGYICVAADPKYMKAGTKLMTSLGPAKVYDSGCSYGTIDVYVDW